MFRSFLVKGKSMEPAVGEGALVLVRKMRREPSPGEIVVYRHPHKNFAVVHRVRQKDRSGWLLGGDNNQAVDPVTVPVQNIYGRVWLICPRLGRLLHFIRRGAKR